MKKIGHYRRAVWLQRAGQPPVLAETVSNCIGQIPARTFHVFDVSNDSQCLVARRIRRAGSVFLHLVVFERGARAAIIPIARRSEEVLASEVDAPDGNEFIQSQIFCRLSGNHAIWTTHNASLRDSSITAVFARLIGSLDDQTSTQFEFQAQIDPDAYRRAFRRGIAEIDLGLGNFRSTLEALTAEQRLPVLGFLSGLSSLVTNEPTGNEIEAASMVEGKLTLKPGRDWDRPHVTELLSKMAEGVVAGHEEEFVIVTKDGLRLTQRKMSVHREYETDGNKHVLNSLDVSTALDKIYDDLIEAQIVEQ